MVARTLRVPAPLWNEAMMTADRNDDTLSDVIRRMLEQYVQENR